MHMHRLSRLTAAFLLAPLTVPVLFAVTFWDIGGFATVVLAYPLALIASIFGYALLRSSGLLRIWQFMLVGMFLGALIGWGIVYRPSAPPPPPSQHYGAVVLTAVFGLINAIVFWSIAFGTLTHRKLENS
jgi:uncharacterized protein (DUF2062 family)